MSKPKELNFFVEELNWDLGLDWYASRFDDRFKVRGESSPHYTNLPRFEGVAERIHEHCPDARLLYMVRDPIKRILSHWVHATGAGYETGDLVETLSRPDTSYMNRSKYWMQLQPYLELLRPRADRDHHPGGAAARTRGDDAQGLRLRRRRRELHLRAVRPRVGEVRGQGGRQIPADGEADQTAGLPLLRPQLRPPAGVDALAGREGRPRSRQAAGREAEAARRPLRDRPRPLHRGRRRACRSSPAASSPAGTTTADGGGAQ